MSSFFVFIVRGRKFGLLSSDFSLSDATCCNSVFLEFYRLSCHGRFVTSQLNRLEAQAINGDVHAVLDHNDVAHMQIVVVKSLKHAISEHSALKGICKQQTDLPRSLNSSPFLTL